MKHEVHLPQGTIRYREDGTGEPLLFVHGVAGQREPVAQGRPAALEGLPLHRPRLAVRVARDRRWRRTPISRRRRSAQMIVDFMDALGLETVDARRQRHRRRALPARRGGASRPRLAPRAHVVRHLRPLPAAAFQAARPGRQGAGLRLADRAVAAAAVRAAPPDRVRLGHEAPSREGRRRRSWLGPGADVARRPARPREDLPRGRLALHDRGGGEAEELRQAGPARVGGRGQAVPARVRAPARRRPAERDAARRSRTPTRSSPRTSRSGSPR